KKLEAEKWTYDIGLLKPLKAAVEKSIAELEANKEEAKIEHLAIEAHKAEATLNFELLNSFSKSRHVDHGRELIARADLGIKKLETEKKVKEIEILKADKAVIEKLIAELPKATDKVKIGQIETELRKAENKLIAE